MEIQDLWRLGMKGYMPPLIEPMWMSGPVLNLGAGNSPIDGAVNLERPEWDAEEDELLMFEENTVAGIFAFHFFEHLAEPRDMLRECERVLMPGAPLTIVVPHAWGTMAFHDLDHKKFFVLDTWKNMLDSTWQSADRSWRFEVGFNFVIGSAERNLALLTQLIKSDDD